MRAKIFWAHGKRRDKAKRDYAGQNLIEYAIVVAIIASAMLVMSTYVFRSVQATQQKIHERYAD